MIPHLIPHVEHPWYDWVVLNDTFWVLFKLLYSLWKTCGKLYACINIVECFESLTKYVNKCCWRHGNLWNTLSHCCLSPPPPESQAIMCQFSKCHKGAWQNLWGVLRVLSRVTVPLQGLAGPLDRLQNTCYTVFMKLRNLKNREIPKSQKTKKVKNLNFKVFEKSQNFKN